MTPPRLGRLTLALSLAAALTTGCTADDPPAGPSVSPTGAGSSSGTGASPTGPTLTDRSGEVVDGAGELTPIATTTGRPSSTFAGATFTFYRLTAASSSTLLVWRVTGGPASNPNEANVRSWAKYPRMLTGGKEYFVVTFDKQNDGWSALSNPILRLSPGEESPPQSALYPPLPVGTTKVTLKGPWFADVEVPVTAVS